MRYDFDHSPPVEDINVFVTGSHNLKTITFFSDPHYYDLSTVG